MQASPWTNCRPNPPQAVATGHRRKTYSTHHRSPELHRQQALRRATVDTRPHRRDGADAEVFEFFWDTGEWERSLLKISWELWWGVHTFMCTREWAGELLWWWLEDITFLFNYNLMTKVHHWSLNLCRCVIPVPKLTNRPFNSLNLSIRVISVHKLVPKLENQTFMSSNLFNHIISVPKLDFESHMDQNRAI